MHLNKSSLVIKHSYSSSSTEVPLYPCLCSPGLLVVVVVVMVVVVAVAVVIVVMMVAMGVMVDVSDKCDGGGCNGGGDMW